VSGQRTSAKPEVALTFSTPFNKYVLLIEAALHLSEEQSGDINIVWSSLCGVQAFQLLENFPEAVPYVFLITDGAVADERNICLSMQSRIIALGARAPRISTFGIGRWYIPLAQLNYAKRMLLVKYWLFSSEVHHFSSL
jgi:hypothetical protein